MALGGVLRTSAWQAGDLSRRVWSLDVGGTYDVGYVHPRVSMRLGLLFSLTLTTLAYAQTPREILDRALADFSAGRVEEAAEGFDQVARVQPDFAPQLWQRGIALYYAGRYEDCRRQFESHLTVNPSDVENSAWHFLCVARAESPERARAALLPVGPDARLAMRQIYDMFRGTASPFSVLTAAGQVPSAQFYAYLYLGLYYEAIGDPDRAREHMEIAAGARYRSVGGYTHAVARMHLELMPQPRSASL